MTIAMMRRAVSISLLILQVIPTAMSQNGGPPVDYECFSYYGMALEVVATAGSDTAGLCATTGALYSLMSSGQACMSTVVTSVPRAQFSQLNSVLAQCNSEAIASSSSVCASASAQNQPCSAQVSYFGQGSLTVATSGSSPSSSGASPASSVSQTVNPSNTLSTSTVDGSSTATQTSSPERTSDPSSSGEGNNSPSVGLIAGIAIGSALGVAILVGVFAMFFWRYRRQRKQDSSSMTQSSHSPSSPAPPTYESRTIRSELATPLSAHELSAKEDRRIRHLSGLQELDAADAREKEISVGELESNESPEPGMRTWYSSGISDETAVDHSARTMV